MKPEELAMQRTKRVEAGAHHVSRRPEHRSTQAGGTSAGHSGHADMVSDFRRRFWICLALTVPVVLLSPMIQRRLGIGRLAFSGQDWVQLLLASIVFFYGGWPFLSGLFSELSRRRPGMMTLIGLATTVAYLYSTAAAFRVPREGFFLAPAAPITNLRLAPS